MNYDCTWSTAGRRRTTAPPADSHIQVKDPPSTSRGTISPLRREARGAIGSALLLAPRLTSKSKTIPQMSTFQGLLSLQHLLLIRATREGARPSCWQTTVAEHGGWQRGLQSWDLRGHRTHSSCHTFQGRYAVPEGHSGLDRTHAYVLVL